MNREQAAFVAAIVADPTDRTAVLVFADWLDENDAPLAARALRAHSETPRLIERVGGRVGRRQFFLIVPQGMGLMESLAVAHAFGLPRPGDAHPLYEMIVTDIYTEAVGESAISVLCEYL
jgi:uncharacterized protein (TIGR02996 family)